MNGNYTGARTALCKVVKMATKTVDFGNMNDDARTADDARNAISSDDLDQSLPAAALDAAIRGLTDPRRIVILTSRVLASPSLTLDEIGQQLGITRERVRQLEVPVRRIAKTWIEPGGPLAGVTEAVRSLPGVVMRLIDAVTIIPSLSAMVESLGAPLWEVVDRLDETVEIRNGWLARPSLRQVRRQTEQLLAEVVNAHGVASFDACYQVLCGDAEWSRSDTKKWLKYCDLIVADGMVYTKTRNVADYAAGVLSLARTPLSAREITDRFAIERNFRSVSNQMSLDARFTRVDQDAWALTEWGLKKYSSIRGMIAERISQDGGLVKLDDLVADLTSQFTISATSVLAYANAPEFDCRKGVVTFAKAQREHTKPPESTERLFRHDSHWSYRIQVTSDHLRGSSFQAPVGIVTMLGVGFGEEQILSSRLGPQAVRWTGLQPGFGTIRRFLLDSNIDVGTVVFLVIGDDGSFDVEIARPLTGDPLVDALALIGAVATDDTEQIRWSLARAAGLETAASTTNLIAAYRSRGDHDVADLLTAAWQ